jgi:hypothetical protein
MPRILGADPGKTGALFLVDFDFRRGVHADMPVAGKGVDHVELASILDLFGPIDLAVVEHVSSSPQMGVVSAFSFGHSFGALTQALASADIQTRLVSPNLWTKALGVVGKSREGANARARADELMPYLSHHWPLKKHDGRVDASLLAYYGSKL